MAPWGAWKDPATCPGDKNPVNGFNLKANQNRNAFDKVGAIQLLLSCTNSNVITAGFVNVEGVEGDWQSSFFKCPVGSAVAGLRTRVQKPQGTGKDDAGLVGVRMFCRKIYEGIYE